MSELSHKYVSAFVISLLFFVSLFGMPVNSNAGGGMMMLFDIGKVTTATDGVNNVLIGYWDLRDRSSYFQVTNESADPVRVHIQIFNASDNCVEFDYYDTYTPRDTHVYDVSSLDRNNGSSLNPPVLTGGHGIIAISHVNTANDIFNHGEVLTGNFRILDNDGYEYRTNLSGLNYTDLGPLNPETINFDHKINFNNVDSSTLADLVVIPFTFNEGPQAGIQPFAQVYNVTMYDKDENPISCPPVLLGCQQLDLVQVAQNGDIPMDVGINQAITNSRGGPSLCLGSETTGYLEIDKSIIIPTTRNLSQVSLNGIINNFPGYIIFMGLNNGSGGTGSMDSATGSEEFFGGVR